MKSGTKIAIAVAICLLIAFVGFVGSFIWLMGEGLMGGGPIAFFPEEEGIEEAPILWKVSAVTWPERMIIQRASIKLEVINLNTASERITVTTKEVNGFIADSKTWVTNSGQRKGEITIRVPKDKFLPTIEKIELLGKVESKELSGEDITEEYIDLESRLNNFQQEEGRFLKILKKAKKVSDVLEVEKELARVRREVEKLTGRIKYLENRVELATITTYLHEPEPITPKWKNAFHASHEGFLSMINGIIIFFGYALPVLIVIGIIGAIVIGCKHAYKSRSRPKLKKK